ncbi:MAG TPA: hypothetical protein VK463_20400 [Desulfomonilaceae bacterium]|nr:hypothetical protein [Desulfomonilaceae bacterium]
MKDDEKPRETENEPSEETTESPKQVDRGTFLKAIGVGIGAVGLDLVTGGHMAARAVADMDRDRSTIQKLMRGLLESPQRARDFLADPQKVGAEFGIQLSADDAKTIQEAFKNLTMEAMLREGHSNTSHSESGPTSWANNNHSQSLKIMKPSEGHQPAGPKPTSPTRRR